MAELDAIVEGAIHRYILLPLKPEIYKCMISEYKESGSLDMLDHNIQLARAKTPEELGIKVGKHIHEAHLILTIHPQGLGRKKDSDKITAASTV